MPLDLLVEERIQEAQRRGDFDGLPGAGRPIDFGDDALVPHEVRVANRVLKNAGFVPEEVVERRMVADLEAALPRLPEGAERARVVAKLALLRTRLGAARTRALTAQALYARKVMDKLAGGD